MKKTKDADFGALEAGQDFYFATDVDRGWCRAHTPWTERWADGTSATYNAYTPWGPDWFGADTPVQIAEAA